MNVTSCILNNMRWEEIPDSVKMMVGNSKEMWLARVRKECVENCVRWQHSMVKELIKESDYYVQILENQMAHLKLYPYHIAEEIMRFTKVSDFQFYVDMLESMIKQEKSYDALPNFSARDCTRLTGIGRNQYIDMMNRCRGKGWSWNKKNQIREELPKRPLPIIPECWWLVVRAISVSELPKSKGQDLSPDEISAWAAVKDGTAVPVTTMSTGAAVSLYQQGLVYFAVPIDDNDIVSVPPLRGFVMNRSTDDSFEQLLYRVFVSLDGKTSVSQLSELLHENLENVRHAISIYCRLGFAKKVTPGPTNFEQSEEMDPSQLEQISIDGNRIGFIVDKTIAALLMMGNLSPELKPHAVTLYEVGKLTADDMSGFLEELRKVAQGAEEDSHGLGADEYFEHASILLETLSFLMANKSTDMIRCESLGALSRDTCQRLLLKNYQVLLSMTPTTETVPVREPDSLPLYGAPSAHFHSPWFRLFLYELTGSGPTTLLLPMGYRLETLPHFLQDHTHFLVCRMDGSHLHEIRYDQLLTVANHHLLKSPILVQPIYPNAVQHTIELPCVDESRSNLPPAQLALLTEIEKHLELPTAVGVITLMTVNSCVLLHSIEFGIPMHKRKSNELILRRMAQLKLLEETAVANHKSAMSRLYRRLLRFIDEHCGIESLGEGNTHRFLRHVEAEALHHKPAHPSVAVYFDGIALDCLSDPLDNDNA
eukprot:c14300_g1_i1.p1 GENE.c14300_g1_i1~~c14300_g1_i1.p1  ORF type:complete len:709 (+),score=167.37 c14300_g1_i1:41-2167(+)